MIARHIWGKGRHQFAFLPKRAWDRSWEQAVYWEDYLRKQELDLGKSEYRSKIMVHSQGHCFEE